MAGRRKAQGKAVGTRGGGFERCRTFGNPFTRRDARDERGRFGALPIAGVRQLGEADEAEVGKLSAYKGMGTASFTQFAVVREIGRRILEEELQEEITLSDPDTVADYLRFHLGQEKVEVSVALLLNRQNQLIAVRELSRGTVAENTIYIREIVKLALDEYADSLIIAHNHPGGSPEPSQEDIMFTRRLAQAMSLVDVSLLDHFIVTSQTVRSFRQLGLMP